MKSAILFAIAMGSVSALAADRFVCSEYDRKSEKHLQRVVVLVPQEEGPLKEGVKMAYKLEIYEGPEVVADTEVDGTVVTEDVAFNFTSNDRKIRFHIYLDELNESGLTVRGKRQGSYICR